MPGVPRFSVTTVCEGWHARVTTDCEVYDCHTQNVTTDTDCKRILDSQIMDSEFMPEVRLDELLAAYELPRVADEKTVCTRRRLADFLITNRSIRWDTTRLSEHRIQAGGHWRDLVKGARKRKVEGERGASNVPASSRHHARDGRKARRMPLPFQNAKKYVAGDSDDDADEV